MGMRRERTVFFGWGVADDAVPDLETNKDTMGKFRAK